jgi:Rrf2 family nitric oxide-sensitive transcriptional repressor
VHNLSSLGYIHSTRGKGGGLSLAHAPGRINLGDVVRHTEMTFDIVECFDSKNRSCPITPVCRLKNVLGEASRAFLDVLDSYTLADVMKNEQRLSAVLKLTRR